jgi:hypothetical protein
LSARGPLRLTGESAQSAPLVSDYGRNPAQKARQRLAAAHRPHAILELQPSARAQRRQRAATALPSSHRRGS